MDANYKRHLEWLTGLEERVQQVVTKCIRPPIAQIILSLSIFELRRLTSLSVEELLIMRRKAALFLQSSTPSTLLDIWMGHREDLAMRRLTTGCSSIDQVLAGGILSRGVTEIAGESGAGKTQFCLQLCLTVQLPESHGGLGGAAMYISTEDVFPHKRLHQLAPRFFAKHRGLFVIESTLTDKIYIEHAASSADLTAILDRVLAALPDRPFRLLVIDSVAAIYRSEFSLDQGIARAHSLLEMGGKLHKLSHLHNLPIVCINQVTSVVGANSGEDSLMPSLGLAWSNVVTSRMMLSKTHTDELGGEGYPGRRAWRVVFAPHLPQNQCNFVVCEDGVCSPPRQMGI